MEQRDWFYIFMASVRLVFFLSICIVILIAGS